MEHLTVLDVVASVTVYIKGMLEAEATVMKKYALIMNSQCILLLGKKCSSAICLVEV